MTNTKTWWEVFTTHEEDSYTVESFDTFEECKEWAKKSKDDYNRLYCNQMHIDKDGIPVPIIGSGVKLWEAE